MFRKLFLAAVLGLGVGGAAVAYSSPDTPATDGQSVGIEGRWFMAGDPRQPCFIQLDGRGFLVLTNERGEQSRGRLLPGGRIIADDWGGLIGDVRGNEIFWRNGDRWAR
jgi:hypothetical protein